MYRSLQFLCVLLWTFLFACSVHGDFVDNVNDFADHLNNYAKQSLGVEYLQDHFDTVTSSDAITVDGKARLDVVVSKFNEKTSKAKTVLKKLRDYIEDENTNSQNQNRPLHDCCGYDQKLEWNNLLQAEVNLNDFCEISPRVNHSSCPISKAVAEGTPIRLLEDSVLSELKDAYTGSDRMARFIYYGREDGYYIQYPAQNNHKKEKPFCECSQYDARFGPWYVATLSPKDGRDVIIAIDFSTNMQKPKVRELMINVVETLLDSLDGKDRILVSLFREGRRNGPSCMEKLTFVTPALIKALKEYIQKESVAGNYLRYVDIFEESLDKFKESERKTNLYIVSSGKNIETKSTVIDVIKKKMKKLNCSLNVDMLLITTGSLSPERNENHREFMREICGCSWCTTEDEGSNQLIEFDTYYPDIDDIRSKIGKIYANIYDDDTSGSIRFTLPHMTFNSPGTYLDACTRCMNNQNRIIGVACISFLSKELFGLDFEQTDDMYVFLIDSSGKTFIHPKYAEPVLSDDRPFPLDIRRFETSDEFIEIYNSMKSGDNGNKTIRLSVSVAAGSGKAIFVEKNLTYYWNKIEDSPFSIAVVVSDVQKSIPFAVTKTGQKETYHRLDIYNTSDNACLVKNTIAIASESIIKLPTDVFERPVTYYEDETVEKINKITDYLEMKTNITPGMFVSVDTAANVRESVVATSTVTKGVWTKDLSYDSIYSIWRYVGTEDGCFRSFPAHRMHPYYDPRARPWYIQAKANPNGLILTTPYEDSGTGTTMITLAKTLFKKHPSGNVVAGVMGIDFNVPYLQSLIFKYIRECQMNLFGSKCVIIDESGFLIFHPTFENAVGMKKHVTEKEPDLAKHMIDSDLMKKDYCIGYFKQNLKGEVATAHVKWFYGVKHITMMSEHKEGCMDYILTPILGTNMVLIKIKESCNTTNACSCPKDSKNTCEKSKITDKKICECPCNDYKVCFSELPPLKSSLICEASDKRTKIDVKYTKSWISPDVKKALQPCIDPMCSRSSNSLQCHRLYCEWCFMDANRNLMEDSKRYCGNSGTCPMPVTTKIPPPDGISETTVRPGTPEPHDGGMTDGEIAALVVCLVLLVIITTFIVYYIMKKKEPTAREAHTMENRHAQPTTPSKPPDVVTVNGKEPEIVHGEDDENDKGWF